MKVVSDEDRIQVFLRACQGVEQVSVQDVEDAMVKAGRTEDENRRSLACAIGTLTAAGIAVI